MSSIETEKFNNMVQAIGSNSISAIVTSSPEIQVRIYCVCLCVCVCVCVCVCARVRVCM